MFTIARFASLAMAVVVAGISIMFASGQLCVAASTNATEGARAILPRFSVILAGAVDDREAHLPPVGTSSVLFGFVQKRIRPRGSVSTECGTP
jgi:hypothetical protein